MSGLNKFRIVVGGAVAGLVMNVIDGVVNGVVLGGQWESETNLLNPELVTRMATTSTLGWILVDFLTGIVLV